MTADAWFVAAYIALTLLIPSAVFILAYNPPPRS